MSAGYRAVGGGGEECGIVSSVTHWDAEETRCWLALQFTGLAALYFARCFLVVSIVPMSVELGWDERQCVSLRYKTKAVHECDLSLTQGIVLSAFYWGYVLTQVLGGSLSDRYGGDVVQWVAGVVWSLSTLSSIYLAQVSIWPLVLARFLTGLAQGQLAFSLSAVIKSVPSPPKACITRLCPVWLPARSPNKQRQSFLELHMLEHLPGILPNIHRSILCLH